MQVKNLLIHDVPDEVYFKMPGVSFSTIKAENKEPFLPTEKMRIGTLVHRYLLTPSEYDFSNYNIVRPAALALKKAIGAPLLPLLKTEIAVTADFNFNGLCMKYKGKIDAGIIGKLVIDVKVTELDILKAIEFFKYDDQTNGYALSINARLIIIIAVHPYKRDPETGLNRTQVVSIPLNDAFWRHQILRYGKPVENV